jgi:hypothetical protein
MNFIKAFFGLVLATACWMLVGCDDLEIRTADEPTIARAPEHVETVPKSQQWIESRHRVRNYGPSCGHATVSTILRASDRPLTADWWEKTHRGGVTLQSLYNGLQRADIFSVWTTKGDLEFVKRHLDRGEKVGVAYPGKGLPIGHFQTAYRYDEDYIYLLDNNDTKNPRGVPWKKFLRGWDDIAFALPTDPPY